MGFNGNAPLPLQVHAVQHLFGHFALVQGTGKFQQSVRQGGLPVVNVGDDAKVANVFYFHPESFYFFS